MLADLLIDLVVAMVSPLLDLLPDVDLSGFTTGVTNGVSTAAGWAMVLNPALPISELLALLSALGLLIPLFLAYKVFSWVWRHVPTIAGFGTGNG